MTRAPAVRCVALGALVAGLASGILDAQSYRTVTATRTATGEESLEVRVEFAAGTLRLMPGDGRMLYQGEIFYDEDKFEPAVDYDANSGPLTWRIHFSDWGVSRTRRSWVPG